ncbi:MAG TPA: hypothetical protein VFQ76_12095, partial [Longimicrobiaceae bacterium]|nr:hypothetical protein [Longimicrobiaceae bacterium]
EELRLTAEAVQSTIGSLREESKRLRAEREEALAAVHRSRDELRGAVESLPPTRYAARPGARGES